jgi:deazaflavin-dependent oxidoreductase (nitroreductase family)
MRPDRKARLVIGLQRYTMNPFIKPLAGLLPVWIKLETVGRKSGKPRRTPLGMSREGDTVWIVSEQGWRAQYVRNIAVNPRVRVKVRGRWHDGTAEILESVDAQERLAHQSAWNRMAVRSLGTDLLTLRIELDPKR